MDPMAKLKQRRIRCPRCGSDTTEPDPQSLRAVREAAGLSLGDMARETGLSVPYLSDVERGRRRVTPRITGLYRRLEGEG